ncbi:Hsp70 family protein [Clostridium sp. HCS.1]|uniref:Hsp70 family protein n=1 Tax=Clostridium sp. HCS.1 TaxID=3238594 RepID=UPI003A102122
MEFFGIDFGNGTCSISKIDETGSNLELLKNISNEEKIKSKIHFIDLENVSVGKEILKSDELENIELIKSKFGIEKGEEIVSGQIRSIQYCGAVLLNYLIKKVARKDNLKKVVITIPTIYGEIDRRILYESAQQASIEEVELIEEPSAAALYHIYKKYRKDKEVFLKGNNLLVFDFGTGTLDLSVVEIDYNKEGIKLIINNTKGARNLGGYLLDLLFAKYLLEIYIEKYMDEWLEEAFKILNIYIQKYINSDYRYLKENVDLKMRLFIKDLILYAENLKIRLSEEERVNTEILNYKNIVVEREEFESNVIDGLLSKRINDLINEFNSENTYKIDEIVMVGGMSQIPYIKNILENKFKNKKITTDKEYINAISLGAAIASGLNSGANIEPFGSNRLNSVLSKDIFISFNNKSYLIFKKGASYPCKKIQKVEIPYSLCSSISVSIKEDDTEIDKIEFYHPCFYTGDILNLKCFIDEKGIMKFEAEHDDSKEILEMEINNKNRLNSKQINAGREFINKKLNYI